VVIQRQRGGQFAAPLYTQVVVRRGSTFGNSAQFGGGFFQWAAPPSVTGSHAGRELGDGTNGGGFYSLAPSRSKPARSGQ